MRKKSNKVLHSPGTYIVSILSASWSVWYFYYVLYIAKYSILLGT